MNQTPYEAPLEGRAAALSGRPSLRPGTVEALGSMLREAAGGLWPLGGGRDLRQLPPDGAALLDMRGLNRVLGFDGTSLSVAVEAGVTFGQLEAVVEGHGASLCAWRREDPGATIGGLLSRRRPVGHALWNGDVREACVALGAITGAGQPYRYLEAPRKAAGPDLRHLFIGAEGAFGVITAATLGVGPKPEARRRVQLDSASPAEALAWLSGAFAGGLRAPNALYSGAARRAVVHLEGSAGAVEVMRLALKVRAEALGLSLADEETGAGPEASWGTIRHGGDPASGREGDPLGAVSVWGSPRDLARLPEAAWASGVLYDVSAHQAALWLPAGAAAQVGIEGLATARSTWWQGDAAQTPHPEARAQVGAGLMALKAALDPRGVLPPVAGGEA